MGKLDGKTAVITGGSSGIGLASAHRFIDEGAQRVFITGRGEADLVQARTELGEAAVAITGDAADLEDLDSLAEAIRASGEGLDVIVANAGYVDLIGTQDASPEHFDTTFNTNTRGPFFAVQKLLPLLRDNGTIVLVATSGHVKGLADYATYLASKAALRSLARSWADDFKSRGIRVNVVSPGPIDTGILDKNLPKEQADVIREQYKAMIPLGRMGRAEEVAAAVLFLASDESSFATGIDLVVDGGQTQL